jgi:hypothetical protein
MHHVLVFILERPYHVLNNGDYSTIKNFSKNKTFKAS